MKCQFCDAERKSQVELGEHLMRECPNLPATFYPIKEAFSKYEKQTIKRSAQEMFKSLIDK